MSVYAGLAGVGAAADGVGAEMGAAMDAGVGAEVGAVVDTGVGRPGRSNRSAAVTDPAAAPHASVSSVMLPAGLVVFAGVAGVDTSASTMSANASSSGVSSESVVTAAVTSASWP